MRFWAAQTARRGGVEVGDEPLDLRPFGNARVESAKRSPARPATTPRLSLFGPTPGSGRNLRLIAPLTGEAQMETPLLKTQWGAQPTRRTQRRRWGPSAQNIAVTRISRITEGSNTCSGNQTPLRSSRADRNRTFVPAEPEPARRQGTQHRVVCPTDARSARSERALRAGQPFAAMAERNRGHVRLVQTQPNMRTGLQRIEQRASGPSTVCASEAAVSQVAIHNEAPPHNALP